jgi:hypothetical protein
MSINNRLINTGGGVGAFIDGQVQIMKSNAPTEGTFISYDFGQSFSLIPVLPTAISNYDISSDGLHIVAWGQYVARISHDAGATWTSTGAANDRSSMCINDDGQRLVDATNGQLYYSTNGGVSWSPSSGETGRGNVFSSPDGLTVIHMSTGTTSTQRSTNGGASFSNYFGSFGSGTTGVSANRYATAWARGKSNSYDFISYYWNGTNYDNFLANAGTSPSFAYYSGMSGGSEVYDANTLYMGYSRPAQETGFWMWAPITSGRVYTNPTGIGTVYGIAMSGTGQYMTIATTNGIWRSTDYGSTFASNGDSRNAFNVKMNRAIA